MVNHHNRQKPTSAVFLDGESYILVRADRECYLGHYNPGRYIWADRGEPGEWQVCDGGRTRGNTLSWPAATNVTGWRPMRNKMGQTWQEPIYDTPYVPSVDLLEWLAKTCGARSYKTRAACERHFLKAA